MSFTPLNLTFIIKILISHHYGACTRFKLGSNGIYYTVNNATLGLLGPAKPEHAPAQLCNAWVLKVNAPYTLYFVAQKF
jgi:hypothetical protein